VTHGFPIAGEQRLMEARLVEFPIEILPRRARVWLARQCRDDRYARDVFGRISVGNLSPGDPGGGTFDGIVLSGVVAALFA
jgi:hypothetical protein